MTQANLLELAKNGNPQAIASLMNSVLESKGVVAKTHLDGDCLHILFTSEHTLSQSALVSFVKNGLNTLGAQTFQRVKLYARKHGQEAPLWVESFATGMTPAAQSVPPVPPPNPVKVQTTLPNLNSAPAPIPTTPSPHPVAKRRPTPKAKPRPKFVRQIQQSLHGVKSGHLNWAGLAGQYKVAIAISASAFLIGGAVALLTNTQAKSTVQSAVPSSASSVTAPTEQAIVPPSPAQPESTPETQVETYLAQMNKAQQAFFQTNGRFATTLEELERSASVMSHSTHYTYRLVLRDQSQSVLTATPKQEGLSSYSGTVLPVDASQPNTMATIICKTNQPSTYPPILAQATGQPILCPADATQVTN